MPGTRLVHVFTMFWNPPQTTEAAGDWCVGGGASIVDRDSCLVLSSQLRTGTSHTCRLSAVGVRGLLLELRWGTNKGRRLTAEIFDGNRRVAKVWLHREDAGARMRSL